MIDATEAEIAWAAGLWEGEGTCGVVTRGTLPGWCGPHAALAMTDEEPVRRFHRIVGVGHFRAGKPGSNGGRKPLYWWKSGSKKDVPVLALLLPYLSPRRAEQLEKALSACGFQSRDEYMQRAWATRRAA